MTIALPAAGQSLPPGRYRLRHAAAMEWIKLRSLRSVKLALAAGVVAGIGLGGLIGSNTVDPHADVTNNLLACVALVQVVFGTVGVLTVTGEYSSGTILSTFAAIPDRGLVLTAKAAVFGAVALAAGEITVFGAFFAGEAALGPRIPHPSPAQPGVLRAVVFSGAYLALIGLIGLALGAIIRHGAGAVGTLVGVVFVLPALRLSQYSAEKFFPEIIAANSLGATRPAAGQLAPWAGLGVIALYTGLLLVVARNRLVRRDA